MGRDGSGFDISKLFGNQENSKQKETSAADIEFDTPESNSQPENRYDSVNMNILFLPQYLGSVKDLNQKNLEDFLRGIHREANPDFPVFDDDEPTHGIMDTHGNEHDLLKAISSYIIRRYEGKKGRLYIDGDLCDPLQITDRDGNPVCPAYTDFSIEAVPIVRKIQEWAGKGNIIVVNADHLTPGLRLSKFGRDSTELTYSQLTPEEKKIHKGWIAELPLFALINKVFTVHAGAVPALESIDEIAKAKENFEKYLRGEKGYTGDKFSAPPLVDDDNYLEKALDFYKNSIIGQAIMGELRPVTFIEGEKKKEILARIVSKERNVKFFRNMKKMGLDVNQIYTGHHGAARIIYLDKDVPGKLFVKGTRVYAETERGEQQVGTYQHGIEKYFTKFKQTAIVTSEGSWSEKTERQNYGPCSKASWFEILKSEPNTLLIGEVGEKLARVALDYEDLEQKVNPVEKVCHILEEQHRKKAINPKWYNYFSRKGVNIFAREFTEGKKEAIEFANNIMGLENDKRKGLIGIVTDTYFDNMYPNSKRYFKGGIFG